VIVNHTIAIFDSFATIPLKRWIASDILFFVCKMAVPLFVMLSGALLLGKEESYKRVFVNKVAKTTLIVLIWSIIYRFIYVLIINNKLLSLDDIMRCISEAFIYPVSIHFWYLYMLIGLYLMTPFVRKMVKNFSEKDYIIFLIFWLVFSSLLPFINLFEPIKYPSYFEVPLFASFIGYYVSGYFLDNIKINRRIIIIFSAIFIVGLLISTSYTYYLSSIDNKTSRVLDNVLMFPIVISSLSCFVLIKYWGIYVSELLEKKKRIKNYIINISSKTFGIYLIHIIVIYAFEQTNLYNSLFSGYRNSIKQTLLFDCIIFILCFLIITVIKKIPLIKNIT
jgi:surface polysaccharide O-acyltransferase-like enzyme